MADLLALDLVDKRLLTDQIVLTVGYDIDNINDYIGPVEKDFLNVTRDRNAGDFKDVKSVEESTESSEGEPKETQNVFNLKYF